MTTDRSVPRTTRKPSSRLCNADRTAPEHTYLFEALRELTFETCREIAGTTLRIGLAASTWQLEQALQLLEQFQPDGHKQAGQLAPSKDRAIALALDVNPRQRKRRAQGLITLHRDTENGLELDHEYQPMLDAMRSRGARLVEVEHHAFDRKLPLNELLTPLIQALANSVEAWGATDIVATCSTKDQRFYCGQLGFKRVVVNPDKDRVLLHLPARRIARLQARHTNT